MEDLQDLFYKLNSRNLFQGDKTYDEFKSMFNDETYKQQVFNVATREGLFTGDMNAFRQKYDIVITQPNKSVLDHISEGVKGPVTQTEIEIKRVQNKLQEEKERTLAIEQIYEEIGYIPPVEGEFDLNKHMTNYEDKVQQYVEYRLSGESEIGWIDFQKQYDENQESLVNLRRMNETAPGGPLNPKGSYYQNIDYIAENPVSAEIVYKEYKYKPVQLNNVYIDDTRKEVSGLAIDGVIKVERQGVFKKNYAYYYTPTLPDGSKNPLFGTKGDGAFGIQLTNVASDEQVQAYEQKLAFYEKEIATNKIINNYLTVSEEEKELVIDGTLSPYSLEERINTRSYGEKDYEKLFDKKTKILIGEEKYKLLQKTGLTEESIQSYLQSEKTSKRRPGLGLIGTEVDILYTSKDIKFNFNDYIANYKLKADEDLKVLMDKTQETLTVQSSALVNEVYGDVFEKLVQRFNKLYTYDPNTKTFTLLDPTDVGETFYDGEARFTLKKSYTNADFNKMLNDAANKNLAYDPRIIELSKKNQVAFEKIMNAAVETYKPEYKLLDHLMVKQINEMLRDVHFDVLSTNRKKDVIDNIWTLMNRALKDKGFDEEEIELRKREYYVMLFERGLAYEHTGKYDAKGNPIKNLSMFALKDLARSIKQTENIDKRIKELKQKEQDALGAADPGLAMLTGYNPAEQIQNELRQLNLIKDFADDIINAPEKIDGSWVQNFAAGFSSNEWYEYIPFISGLNHMLDASTLKQASDRIAEGKGSAEDKLLIQFAAFRNLSQERTKKMGGDWNGYNAGQITANMMPYIGEFILSSGFFTTARAGATTLLRKTLLKKTDDVITRAISSGTASTKLINTDRAIRGLSWITGTVAQTAANPQHYLTSTLENMTPEMKLAFDEDGTELIGVLEGNGMGFGEAFAKGFGTTWAEFATERTAELLPPLFKGIKKKLPVEVQGAIERLMLGNWMKGKGFDKAAALLYIGENRLAWNGLIGEMFEETLNQPLSNLIMGRPLGEGLDSSFFIEMGQAMAVTAGVFGVGQAAFGSDTPSYYIKVTDKDGKQSIKKFDSESDFLNEVNNLDKDGTFSNSDFKVDLEINNDLVTMDKVEDIINKKENKNKNNITSTLDKNLKDEITATEIEISNEATSEEQKQIDELEIELEEAQSEYDSTKLKNDSKSDQSKQKKKLIELQTKKNNILDPIRERVEKKKRTTAYIKRNKRIQNLLKKADADSQFIESVTGEQHLENLEIDIRRQLSELGILLQETTNKKSKDKILEQIDKLKEELKGLEGIVDPKTGGIKLSQNAIDAKNSHGYLSLDGRNIYINRQAALSKDGGNINVGAHEFLHKLLRQTMRNNPATEAAIGSALHSYVMNINPKKVRNKGFRTRLLAYQNKFDKFNFRALSIQYEQATTQKEKIKIAQQLAELEEKNVQKNGEEVMALVSDAVFYGDFVYNPSTFKKIGNVIHRTLRRYGIRSKFRTGEDVFNYLREYNRNVSKGDLDAAFIRDLKEGIKVKGDIAKKAATTKTKAKKGTQMSKPPLKAINDLIPNDVKTKKQYDDFISGQEINPETGKRYIPRRNKELFNAITNPGGVINNYIRSKQTSQEEGDKIIESLTDRVLSFNPEAKRKDGSKVGIDAFGERIFADAAYAKLDARKALAIEQEAEGKTKRIDAAKRTKEGETTFDVEDTTTQETDFETEDVSVTAKPKVKTKPKESSFRNKVGFETGSQIYNQVLESAKKSLILAYAKTKNIKDVAARERAVLDILEKEFNSLTSPLFKQIKNWLTYGIPKEIVPKGSKDIYLQNLQEFREDIIKLISTADLVQIEKMLAESDRVFTRFKGQLTRKADVEKAVNEGRLPPDALRKYDKDKKVNEYEKVIPEPEEIVAFADQPGSIPSKKDPTKMVRSGLKGTRKDGFAKNIVNGLILDATMEARQSQEVQDKISEMGVDPKSVDQLSVTIGRPTNVKFSKDFDLVSSELFDLLTVNRRYKSTLMGTNQITKAIRALDLMIETMEGQDIYQDVITIAEQLKQSIKLGGTFSQIVDNAWSQIEKSGLNNYQIHSTLYDGVLDKKHLENLLGKAKRLTEARIKHIAFQDAVNDLQAGYSAAKTQSEKDQFVIDWLKNNSKSSRTAKVVYNGITITTNEQMYDLIIKPLNNKNFSVDFVNKEKTKTAIFYNGIQITTYEKIIEIKKNPSLFEETINEQAVPARNNFYSIITSNKSKQIKKARVSHVMTDMAGGGRKMGGFAGYTQNPKGKTILEHRPPIAEIVQQTYDYIDNPTKQGLIDLKETIDNSYVILLPKDVVDIINKDYKIKGGLETVMNLPEVQQKIKEKNYKFVNNTNIKFSKGADNARIIDTAVLFSRKANETKGISVLDFDDTLATTKSLVKFTRPDGTTGSLNAEQYASTYENLLDQGYKFDFSDFNKVVEGKLAPLFNKAMKLQSKFGSKNMFVLTARPAAAQKPIYDFLKANGLNIPLKNITGLANSTAEAKALWIAEKVGEGYNDFYFADDALQNVQAVKNMLDQFDVKSKVQQARTKFSKADLNKEFNKILQRITGMPANVTFSEAKARLRGKNAKYKSIIPASAQDFVGLLYNFMGKGKQGEKDMEFFKQALVETFARGIDQLNASKQTAQQGLKLLFKKFPQIKKDLNKKLDSFVGYEGVEFTVDQAIRVYLFNKAGFEIPGLSKSDLKILNKFVKKDKNLKQFADSLGELSKQESGYAAPSEYWLIENINSDLLSDGAVGDARSKFLSEWKENVDQIFSQENLNKIQALYGNKFVEALKDMLYTMETGRNRPVGGGRLMNMYMNWVNNSVGAIMFFNMRSALLQTISMFNYINWSFNNPVKAAAAFANQKQFWSDFTMIFNSKYLKQRRAGNQRGINEAELSAAVATADNKAKAAIAWLLQKGFLPTQIADSFAIASGGATYYRNLVNALMKQGLSKEEAEAKAFAEFQSVTEESQQSSRPDMLSQQQKSPLGRLILSFQNYPMQAGRIINKAFRDIANRRGDFKTHVSKIAYYGFVMNILFQSLQSALWAIGDDDEEVTKREKRILNGMLDTLLATFGFGGRAVSSTKNATEEYLKQRKKGFTGDHTYTLLQLLSFSPPIQKKLRSIYSSIQTEKFNADIMKKRGFTLDNPAWSAIGNVIEGFTNVPLGRLANKLLNIDNALDSNHKAWQRLALLLGWNTWDLGIKDPDLEATKGEVKKEKEEIKNIEKENKKEETKILREEADNYRKKTFSDPSLSIEKSLFDLNKTQQEELLKMLGVKEDELKTFRYEADRIKKISSLKNKKGNKIKIQDYIKSQQKSNRVPSRRVPSVRK